MNGLNSSGQVYDEWSFDTATWRNLVKSLAEIEPVTFTVTNVKPRGVYENLIPVRITYSPPATICYFPDGDKVVAMCGKDDVFSKEVGIMVCIMKKLFGDYHGLSDLAATGNEQPPKETASQKYIRRLISFLESMPDEDMKL